MAWAMRWNNWFWVSTSGFSSLGRAASFQWLQRVGATSGEGVANPLERRQTLAGAEP